MKLGIITDIHNNLIALNTVLEYFAQQNCDKIICCGDIIGIGPYPEESELSFTFYYDIIQ